MKMFEALDLYSDRPALLTADGKAVGYAELLAAGKNLADRISGRNLIFSVASNSIDFVTGYVGFLRSGMVQLIVSETVAPEFLAKLLAIYSPGYIFLPEKIAAKGELKCTQGAYRLLRLDDAEPAELHPDLGLLLSTSGTTGSPKLVRISYGNLQANTESIIRYLGIKPEDRTITTMPLSYSYGLSILNTHLTAGASIVMTEASVMSRDFWNAFKSLAVNSFGGVPYFFEMLKKLKFEKMELPSLRYITQAGGKLGAALAREFTEICLKKNIRFYIMYGQTEATARISYVCATDHPAKAGSIGQAIPGGELWLQDERGEKISATGEPGELIFRGANVSMGFAENRRDLAHGDTRAGTLETGDLATQDPEGFYTIVGRKNRFLKVFGLRLNLYELEELLRAKGYECACSGTDEKLLVYVTRLHDRTQAEALVSQLTGIHKNGFQLLEIDAIPRTSSGKVNYQALGDLGKRTDANH